MRALQETLTLAKMELADFKEVLDVNLTGVFICTRSCRLAYD